MAKQDYSANNADPKGGETPVTNTNETAQAATEQPTSEVKVEEPETAPVVEVKEVAEVPAETAVHGEGQE